ncbi:MAG: hypothetical protein Q4D09_09075 [Clostridia bacterium]|nr:hypothetical protein [Clostridia bacterium]
MNEFDRDDRFLVNILSGAMLAAVYIGLSKKPDAERRKEPHAHAQSVFLGI